MNFIERLFFIAPDDGRGTLEVAVVLIAFLVPVGMAIVRHLRRTQMERGLQAKF
jgi:hypothetical protein